MIIKRIFRIKLKYLRPKYIFVIQNHNATLSHVCRNNITIMVQNILYIRIKKCSEPCARICGDGGYNLRNDIAAVVVVVYNNGNNNNNNIILPIYIYCIIVQYYINPRQFSNRQKIIFHLHASNVCRVLYRRRFVITI